MLILKIADMADPWKDGDVAEYVKYAPVGAPRIRTKILRNLGGIYYFPRP